MNIPTQKRGPMTATNSFVTLDYDGRYWWILQVLQEQIHYRERLRNGKKNGLKKARRYASNLGLDFIECKTHEFLQALPKKETSIPVSLYEDDPSWDEPEVSEDELLHEYEMAMFLTAATSHIHIELIERGIYA
jgi:hypothetical protein